MEDKENNGVNIKDVILLANSLLAKCNVDFEVDNILQCNSDLFLALFYAILGDYPEDVVLDSFTVSSKLHNICRVIDTLANDYLHVDLSHIEPESLLAHDPQTTFNLLEVMDGLLEFLLEQISSSPNDEGGADSDHLSDFAQQIAMETIRKEMNQIEGSSHDTHELIALGGAVSAQSVDNANNFLFLGNQSPDDFVLLSPSTVSSYAQWKDSSTADEITEHSLVSTATVTSSDCHNETESLTNVVAKLRDLQFDQRDLVTALGENHKSSGYVGATKPPIYTEGEAPPLSQDPLKPTNVKRISPSISSQIESEHEYLSLPDTTSSIRDGTSKLSSLAMPAKSESDTTSLASTERRERLDVEVNDEPIKFDLKDKDDYPHLHMPSSVDVTDGVSLDDDDNKRHPSIQSRMESKTRDWQALLNSLQQTVDESKKIREKYFTSLNQSNESITETTQGESSFLSDEELTDVLRETYPRATRKKNVRFEDTISTKTAKDLKKFRDEIKKERKLQKTKNQILSDNFRQHLDEVKFNENEKMASMRHRVDETENTVKREQKKKRPLVRKRAKPVKRLAGVAKPRQWPTKKPGVPTAGRITKRIPNDQLCIGEHDLLPQLLEHFPGIEVSTATLNNMWTKQFRQIEHLTNAASDHKHKLRQKEKQLSEGHMRHSLLIAIMQRQHDQQKRVRELREREKQKHEASRVVKDRRLQTARIRQYYRDYHLQMRAKMLHRRTKEEKIFRHLFEEGLNIQKSRLRELRCYANDKRDEMNEKMRNEIVSLENYYKDQFELLAETITMEKNNLNIRDKAQTKLLRGMKRGLRAKMESEITRLQDMIARDDDDAYYREVEADRVRRQLQLATYNSKFIE